MTDDVPCSVGTKHLPFPPHNAHSSTFTDLYRMTGDADGGEHDKPISTATFMHIDMAARQPLSHTA